MQFAEPDFLQGFVTPVEEALFAREHPPDQPLAGWPPGPEFGWHLRDAFSQLAAARTLVGAPAGNRVRIGILDTGYDPEHKSRPARVLMNFDRDFADDDFDAADPGVHGPADQPGHGTATLALLAGDRVRPRHFPEFDEPLGGAPFAEVIPIRIANSVIHFFSSSMADGIEYATANGCQVISISMGGVPTRRWAQAVNAAYDAGVVIVAAAGNNFGGFPTREIVWPARFRRVIAVCGATAEKTPYFQADSLGMQGNFGPPGKMQTAMAAYTPNMAWAQLGAEDVVRRDGAGTSSATPQVAAAAALWLQHRNTPDGAQPWQQAEAVRHALFTSADESRNDREHFGQGLLRAKDALGVAFDTSRAKTKKDAVWFPMLNLLAGFDRLPEPQRRMLEVEASQLVFDLPDLGQMVEAAEVDPRQLSNQDVQRILKALDAHRGVSKTLRKFLAAARV